MDEFKGDYREAIARYAALKDIEAQVLGLEHPGYANSLGNLGFFYMSQASYVTAESLFVQALKIKEKALGPDHPDTGICVNNLAMLYDLRGNTVDAEPLGLRALKINEKAYGPDHQETAATLNNLAMLYYKQGNLSGAEPLFLRTLKIWEKEFGLDHPLIATVLGNLGLLYLDRSNYAAAEPLFQRSLAIREKALDPNHSATGTSLNNLANLHKAKGAFTAAEPLFKRALKTKEMSLGPDHPEVAVCLDGLADLYKEQGLYPKAEPLLQRAIEIRENVLGPLHPDTAASLVRIGILQTLQGNDVAGLQVYLKALKIYETALGPDHPDTATSVRCVAQFHYKQGNYAAAEPLYQRALKIYEKRFGPKNRQTAKSYSDLAVLYLAQGNSDAAEPLFHQALTITETFLGADHPDTASCLLNLGSLYTSQRNYTAAARVNFRALKIREKALGPNHPETGVNLNDLAATHNAQENYASAEVFARRALKIHETILGFEHPDVAVSLINLAFSRAGQGDSEDAEKLYERALRIRENSTIPKHPDSANCAFHVAVYQWNRGEVAVAASLAERALAVRLQHLDETAAIQTEQQQFVMSRDVEREMSFWLTVNGTDAKWTPAAYRDVLAWKGLITARQQGLRLALKDDPLFEVFRQVSQQLSTVTLSPPLPPSDPKILDAWKTREPELRRKWESRKATLASEHERFEKELAVKSVEFRESLQQRRMQPEDLVAALKAQDQPTALVDLLDYGYYGHINKNEKVERRIVAFVVRGDRPVARVELGSSDAIAVLVAKWRESFGRKVADQDPGAELRQRVWQPLEAHLQGIETILISPDGPSAQLPWGALPGEKPGTYLLEDRAVAVIPVPQMLPTLLGKARRTGPPKSLLLAGDIEYDGDPGQPQDLLAKREAVGRLRDGRLMEFKKLPAAQGELTSIKDWYENAEGTGTVNALRKLKATEAAFREQVTHHQWLHVITHGFFAPPELTAPRAPVAGIGASINVDDGRCLVAHLAAASAAQKDGRLQVGDEIVSVANPDGEVLVTAGKSLDEIFAFTRGPAGSKVHLRVQPKSDATKIVEIVLTRAPLPNQMANTKPGTVHPGLLSGLVFAGANSPPEPEKDDGMLTALEVAALDLNQVDAVVLSACETGLGAVAGGEGLLGLQRAFQVAGARTVVASLWKVPDAHTARLMQRFYENLWEKKLPKLEALREAQLWMLHDKTARGASVDDPHPDEPLPPYFWAAFVLSGDWR